jgi:hypothetical protein
VPDVPCRHVLGASGHSVHGVRCGAHLLRRRRF